MDEKYARARTEDIIQVSVTRHSRMVKGVSTARPIHVLGKTSDFLESSPPKHQRQLAFSRRKTSLTQGTEQLEKWACQSEEGQGKHVKNQLRRFVEYVVLPRVAGGGDMLF